MKIKKHRIHGFLYFKTQSEFALWQLEDPDRWIVKVEQCEGTIFVVYTCIVCTEEKE